MSKPHRLWVLVLGSAALGVNAAQAAECENTSIGAVPLNDLGPGLYLGQFQGGLYPNGANAPPHLHSLEGLIRASAVQPLTPGGAAGAGGRYVLLSIGMSNTTQEFCSHGSLPPCDPWTFMGQAATHPEVEHEELAIVNGARAGQVAAEWEDPQSANYDRILDTWLTPLGLSEAQVQVAWVKVANPRPTVSLPAPAADAFELLGRMGNIARALKTRYPNLQIAFLSSRIYGGYASTELNPEPYPYESAFAVKWLIEAQIHQALTGEIDPIAGDLDYETTPWLAWGPYLWADGLTPRSDGLIWRCEDFVADGTHPSTSAEEKVGTMLLQFMLNSPYAAPWFRAAGVIPGDLDQDGDVDLSDVSVMLAAFGRCAGHPQYNPAADLDRNGCVNLADLAAQLANYGG